MVVLAWPLSVTLPRVADAYVDASHAKSNCGTTPELKPDNSPLQRSYLRFNVQGVSGTITRATLRLFSRTASTAGVDVRHGLPLIHNVRLPSSLDVRGTTS